MSLLNYQTKTRKLIWAFLYLSARIPSEIFGKLIRYKNNNTVERDGLKIDVSSPKIKNRHVFAINFGFYEGGETQSIIKHIDGKLPVIDLGASIGWTSSIISNKIKPPMLISVEADKKLLQICKQNVSKNSQIENIHFENKIIAPNTGNFVFEKGPTSNDGRLVKSLDGSSSSNICTVKDIMSKYGIEECDLVMDIEGAEFLILESSNPLKGVRNIIIDTDLKHPDGKTYEVNWITEKLERNRFIIKDLYPHKATWIIAAEFQK